MDAGSGDGDAHRSDGALDGCALLTYYVDADGDGFGDATRAMDACDSPAGYVHDATDCDDVRAEVHPDAAEVCNGVDDDCNGSVDEGVMTAYYRDADMDGFGDSTGSRMDACAPPVGYVSDATDCDDGAMAVHLGAVEVCDGIVDDNCNGTVDEGCACTGGAARACGTDVGACTPGMQTCTAGMWGACTGGIASSSETCNGVDDDCDGTVDNGNPGGGASCGSDIGVCVAGTLTCAGGSLVCAGEVTSTSEFCDGLDNDCDGTIDEGVKLRFYADCDGDSFGDTSRSHIACTAADAVPFFGAGCGATRDATDCNDDCATCHPGGAETCDGLDNDCDILIDEGVQTSFYRDLDGDGFGAGAAVLACASPASGYVTNNTDCYDASGSSLATLAHPGQAAYFRAGYTGPKPFDYNCDGAQTGRWTRTHSINECMNRDTPLAEGWEGGAPGCGMSGSYVTCTCVALGCADDPPVSRVQECQ